jgi:SSS family solute:Na+ symporter
MNDTVKFGGIDLAVLCVYLVGVVSFGLYMGLRQRLGRQTGAGYFLAGHSLSWVTIGLALFSTNISALHLVSLAQQGYINGLVYGNFEWMAAFALIALALFFAPFYIKTRVPTLPDFLQRRYGQGCRDFLAVISILNAIFIHIGFSLYAGSLILHALFGIDVWVSVITITVLTGLYAAVGGLTAVVMTESVGTIVLLAGSCLLTVFGIVKCGGFNEMLHLIGEAGKVNPAATMSVLRPAGDPSGMPWFSMVLGYPVISIWYWCADQTIVQRVLGAKSENDARNGALFAGFIKILPVFLFVLPGLIYLGLTYQNPVQKTDEVYATMIQDLLPVGLRGVIAAALLAALMGPISGSLNSMATLFSYDLYRRIRPQASDRETIHVGRIATFAGIVIAILWTPLVANFKTIFDGISMLLCFVAPPVSTVFFWGIFWRGASYRGALAALWGGFVLCLGTFLVFYAPLGWAQGVGGSFGATWLSVLTWFDTTVVKGYYVNYMVMSFVLFIICSIILHVVSRLKPDAPDAARAELTWPHPFAALRGPWQGLGDFRLVSGVLLVTMMFLYVIFR